MTKGKKKIAILTGGGDVPGLNAVIRAITVRAIKENYDVIGIRRGWAGLLDIVKDPKHNNTDNYMELSRVLVNKAGQSGGTFLHTTRIRPDKVKKEDIPEHLVGEYSDEINDMTDVILQNLAWLDIDYLIPIGGDDTLGFALKLYSKGIKVVAIPKTMDNDVHGTDYCIGFSTCITRTIQLANQMRNSAESHERFLVLEVFGRNAGYTAMLPTLAGAASRCVIPEYKFNIDTLTSLLSEDRKKNPSKYSILLVSEGAQFKEDSGIDKQQYLSKNIMNTGERISNMITLCSEKYNKGKAIETITQKLGYMVRSGDPDAVDSIVPMVYGNMAIELVLKGIDGRMVCLKEGRYMNVSLDVVTKKEKKIDVHRYYDINKFRPKYKSFEFQPMLLMTES